MRTDLFDYDLPPELIAQTPAPRGDSRLLVLHRSSGRIDHRRFCDLPEYLAPGDLLILNDTRVTARRLRALRPNGLDAEILLLRPIGEKSWEALVKPGRALRIGTAVTLVGAGGAQLCAQISGVTPDGGRIVELESKADRDTIEHWGAAPLPPYIQIPLPSEQEERYQTVYARHAGSAAAPTAGLHFTPGLLAQLEEAGVGAAHVTLHIGTGTFRPVRTETIDEHVMHAETATLSPESAARINAAQGRIVAVGTTSVRTLESAALQKQSSVPPVRVSAFAGETSLFITPGYRFQAVDALITNFHLPRSTLLMLVSAFASTDVTRAAYQAAVERGYRFFSFGDAMLII